MGRVRGTHPSDARGGLRGGGRRRRSQRHGPLCPAHRRARRAGAPGDPLRRGHPRRGDRGPDDRRARNRRDHPRGWFHAHLTVGRAEDRLDRRKGTGDLHPRTATVHARLVAGTQTHRCIRARPPGREPDLAALRRRGRGMVPHVVAAFCHRCRAAGIGVGGRGRRNGDAGGGADHRASRGDTGDHRKHRRVDGGRERGCPRGRRSHVDVRHDDVPGRHRHADLAYTFDVDDGGCVSRNPQPRRRSGHLGCVDVVARRTHRSRLPGTARRGGGVGNGCSRVVDVAVLRRGADTDHGPGRPWRDRRVDPAAHSG